MGTQSVWGYSDIQGVKANKLEHKVSLVTPRMDVDVTGVSLKNVRTHIIDHPRDEGRKHREQLWNFQQKYRGAIGKLRNLPSLNTEESRNEETLSDVVTEDDTGPAKTRAVTSDKTSLHSRFKRRLSQKGALTRIRTGDLDSSRGKRSIDQTDEENRTSSSVRRQYSSGFVVKNSLYNQLRNIDVEGEKSRPDDSRILEAIEKFGSLERLPDIPYMGGPMQPPVRFLRSVNGYSRRLADFDLERRLSFQRSSTNIPVSSSNRRKLLIVSRRGHRQRVVRLDCLGSDNDIEDDEENEDDDEEEEDSDECENVKQNGHTSKPPNTMRIDHHIRSNITQINTQDDMALLQHVLNSSETKGKDGYQTERTFYHGDGKTVKLLPRVESKKLCKSDSAGNLTSTASSSDDSENQKNTVKKVNNKDIGEKEKEKNSCELVSKVTKESNSKKSQKNKKGAKPEVKAEEASEYDESLNIPDDRFGHTTHTIDKKLAIRKPWEWRPSPYRWIDKGYVRESDKPYIERILNTGEVIDEYNYDSFARTKPLKLQNFPEHAGYKDRNGVLR